MYTSDIYFDTIKIIDWVIERHREEVKQPKSYTLAEKITAALFNAGLLKDN